MHGARANRARLRKTAKRKVRVCACLVRCSVVLRFACISDDVLKLRFMKEAVAEGDECFECGAELDPEIEEVNKWRDARSEEEVCRPQSLCILILPRQTCTCTGE